METTGRRSDYGNEAREELIASLAMDLYFTMERADPVDFDWEKTAEANWAALCDFDRDLYMHAVRALLSRKEEILFALGDGLLAQ